MENLVDNMVRTCCFGSTLSGVSRSESPVVPYIDGPDVSSTEKGAATTVVPAEDGTQCSDQTHSDHGDVFVSLRTGPSPIPECSTMEEQGSVSTRGKQSVKSFNAPQPLDERSSVDMNEVRGSSGSEALQDAAEGGKEPGGDNSVNVVVEPSLLELRDDYQRTARQDARYHFKPVTEEFKSAKELFAGLDVGIGA